MRTAIIHRWMNRNIMNSAQFDVLARTGEIGKCHGSSLSFQLGKCVDAANAFPFQLEKVCGRHARFTVLLFGRSSNFVPFGLLRLWRHGATQPIHS
jgi:hypothetical protein